MSSRQMQPRAYLCHIWRCSTFCNVNLDSRTRRKHGWISVGTSNSYIDVGHVEQCVWTSSVRIIDPHGQIVEWNQPVVYLANYPKNTFTTKTSANQELVRQIIETSTVVQIIMFASASTIIIRHNAYMHTSITPMFNCPFRLYHLILLL